MGKASRSKKTKSDDGDTPQGRDLKSIRRVMRRMNLVDSRQPYEAWLAQVARVLPEESVSAYDRALTDPNADSYDLLYRDFAHATLLSVSPRSAALEEEIAWMLPRLRSALDSAGAERQMLVELGAGPGAASAIVSAILGVPVLAVDPWPSTVGLAEQFAAQTGGQVTSVLSSAAELPLVLNGRQPAAVFGMGVFRYFQRHEHSGHSFSFSRRMDHMLAKRQPDKESVDFFEAVAPADVMFSESCCPDYLAEVLIGAHAAGYNLAQDGALVMPCATVAKDGLEVTLFHLVHDRDRCSALHPFMEMQAPIPSPRAGLRIEHPRAEAARLRDTGQIEPVESVEVEYHDGTLRRELFTLGDLAGVYISTSEGYRAISYEPKANLASLVDQYRAEDTATIQSDLATVRPIETPADLW
jgi:hypothetical protein